MKRIIKYSIIVVITSIIIIYAPSIYTTMLLAMQVEPSYKEPDMNIEGYNIKEGIGSTSMPADISVVKDSIIYSIRGEVMDIHKPIIWIEKGGKIEHGLIPVDILVKEVFKGDLKVGSIFTIYVESIRHNPEAFRDISTTDIIEEMDDSYYIVPDEAKYSIGEEVLVHIMLSTIDIESYAEYIDSNLPDQIYITALGKYGKYTIKDNLAYNEKYPYGVPIPYVAYEALP